MKTKPDNNAFPHASVGVLDGLTKREWFAGLALQGMSADHSGNVKNIAYWSVKLADALIEELNKGA